jgi:hypothetical protein
MFTICSKTTSNENFAPRTWLSEPEFLGEKKCHQRQHAGPLQEQRRRTRSQTSTPPTKSPSTTQLWSMCKSFLVLFRAKVLITPQHEASRLQRVSRQNSSSCHRPPPPRHLAERDCPFCSPCLPHVRLKNEHPAARWILVCSRFTHRRSATPSTSSV